MTVSALHEAAPQVSPSVIFVRPSSNVEGIAGTITSSLKEFPRVTLRAIGAGAVNQAIKGTIKARQWLAGEGEDMVIRPGCTTVQGKNGSDVTAIVLHCALDVGGRHG